MTERIYRLPIGDCRSCPELRVGPVYRLGNLTGRDWKCRAANRNVITFVEDAETVKVLPGTPAWCPLAARGSNG